MKKEFTFLGNTMETISIVFGIFLIIWGISITLISNSQSFTSLIPTYLGIPIIILSMLAKKYTEKKKLLMHIVVLIGLLVFLGGLDIFRGLISGNIFNNIWVDLSKIMMLVLGFLFTILCLRSFIYNMRYRKGNENI